MLYLFHSPVLYITPGLVLNYIIISNIEIQVLHNPFKVSPNSFGFLEFSILMRLIFSSLHHCT